VIEKLIKLTGEVNRMIEALPYFGAIILIATLLDYLYGFTTKGKKIKLKSAITYKLPILTEHLERVKEELIATHRLLEHNSDPKTHKLLNQGLLKREKKVRALELKLDLLTQAAQDDKELIPYYNEYVTQAISEEVLEELAKTKRREVNKVNWMND
jgi:hypothetical protein